jgi:hypothetical protein
VTLALGGCETLNGPQAVANAEAQRRECKAVTVPGPQSVRLQNARGVDGDAMQRTEGTLALGQARLNEPPAVRSRAFPDNSLLSQALRDC